MSALAVLSGTGMLMTTFSAKSLLLKALLAFTFTCSSILTLVSSGRGVGAGGWQVIQPTGNHCLNLGEGVGATAFKQFGRGRGWGGGEGFRG